MAVHLTHGPIVGATTDHSAAIWVRASGECDFSVTYGEDKEQPHSRKTEEVHLSEESDFTGVAEMQDLSPNTVWYYEVRLDGNSARELVDRGEESSDVPCFRTFPTAPDSPRDFKGFNFAFGSCFCGYDKVTGSKRDEVFKILSRVRRREGLRFFLMIGDNVYADLYPEEPPKLLGWPPTPSALKQVPKAGLTAFFRQVYQASWQGDHFRRALSRLPTFMTMDDHEFHNDFGKKPLGPRDEEVKCAALGAYRLYQDSHNPAYAQRLPKLLEGGTYDYTFEYGGVPFYVLDSRTGRSPKPESGMRSMLGSAQRQNLIEWLHEHHRAGRPVKFVVSSVPLLHIRLRGFVRRWFKDQWQGWAEERKWILQQISERGITGVCFLSGDVHMNHAVVLAHNANRDLQVYCCTSSGLSMVNPSVQDWFHRKAVKLYRGDDVGLPEYEPAVHVAPPVSALHNFGVVSVRPEADQARIGFEIYCLPQKDSWARRGRASAAIERHYRWISFGFPDHYVPR